MKGTEDEIELFFESGLNNLLSLSQRCEAAATACEQGFQDLSNLTRKFWPDPLSTLPHFTGFKEELSLGCTYKGGSTQQAIEAVSFFELLLLSSLCIDMV